MYGYRTGNVPWYYVCSRYSKNKIPFLKLAEYIPLETLESSARTGLSEEENCLIHLQALLLGTAGLLPSQRFIEFNSGDAYVDTIELFWRLHHLHKTLSPSSWNLFKVRPNNSPLRRLVALSHLIRRFHQNGLLFSLLDAVKNTPVEDYRKIRSAFIVIAAGYWASHCDFGSVSPHSSSTLLGPDRASEIVINVLLPFASAWVITAREIKL